MGMMKLVKAEKQMEGRCTRYEGERKELIPLAAAALLSHLRFTPLDVGRTKSPSPRPSPRQHGPAPSIPVTNRPPEPRCRRSTASRAPPTTVRRADLPWSPADGPTRGRHELPFTDLHLFRLLSPHIAVPHRTSLPMEHTEPPKLRPASPEEEQESEGEARAEHEGKRWRTFFFKPQGAAGRQRKLRVGENTACFLEIR